MSWVWIWIYCCLIKWTCNLTLWIKLSPFIYRTFFWSQRNHNLDKQLWPRKKQRDRPVGNLCFTILRRMQAFYITPNIIRRYQGPSTHKFVMEVENKMIQEGVIFRGTHVPIRCIPTFCFQACWYVEINFSLISAIFCPRLLPIIIKIIIQWFNSLSLSIHIYFIRENTHIRVLVCLMHGFRNRVLELFS